MTRLKRLRCHHCGRPRRDGDSGPLCGPCHRWWRCRRTWRRQFAVAKRLAPSLASLELSVETNNRVRKAVRELARRGHVRVVTCCGGRYEPDFTAYVLTDEGRAHFFLPLPMTIRQHQ